MKTCPYCGEDQHALKNHVRLASDDGHGPSGTYPEDFEDAPSTAGQETGATPSSRDSEPEADVTPSDSNDEPSAGNSTAPADSVVDEKNDGDDTDSDGSDNPVFGDADPDVSSEPDSDPNESVTLPCGHDNYDPTEAPDTSFKATCEVCGTAYKVTPDDGSVNTEDPGVALPCGHESYDPTDAPDEPFVVCCETCGTNYQVEA